jgi:hypothetical protein
VETPLHINGNAALEELRPSIFRVVASWDGCEAQGSGFALGKIHSSGRVVLATAKHVLAVPIDKKVVWQVSQLGERGEIKRTTTFGTDGSSNSDAPFHWHKNLDIGVITFPKMLTTELVFIGCGRWSAIDQSCEGRRCGNSRGLGRLFRGG